MFGVVENFDSYPLLVQAGLNALLQLSAETKKRSGTGTLNFGFMPLMMQLQQALPLSKRLREVAEALSLNLFHTIPLLKENGIYSAIAAITGGFCGEITAKALEGVLAAEHRANHIEKVHIQGEGSTDHVFIVLNRNPETTLANPATWNADAIIFDPYVVNWRDVTTSQELSAFLSELSIQKGHKGENYLFYPPAKWLQEGRMSSYHREGRPLTFELKIDINAANYPTPEEWKNYKQDVATVKTRIYEKYHSTFSEIFDVECFSLANIGQSLTPDLPFFQAAQTQSPQPLTAEL